MTPFINAHDALKSIAMVASDMDGTMTRDGHFSRELFEALSLIKSVGVRVLLVTGRSAGWVNALASLLPIDGAIAENGGLFFPCDEESSGIELLPLRGSRTEHKNALRKMFLILQTSFPEITEAPDNAFRITDWTFSVNNLASHQLIKMKEICAEHDWDFTYSNVQCHITPPAQNKAQGVLAVLQIAPNLRFRSEQVLTIGDSPNDESFFNSSFFPTSVGVANVQKYIDRMSYNPQFVTEKSECDGFVEIARALARAKS